MCIKTVASGAIEGCNASIIDDDIATGLMMRVAMKTVREHKPDPYRYSHSGNARPRLVELLEVADDIVVLSRPDGFLGSVGACYFYFPQATDQEVTAIFATDRLRATRH